ncbi:hypothetical protein F5Y02DRAFT_384282 [Annulohypoxylon stygium]|nr:hypothetical protein F5Y02DRAFT_384282 [Annulohypoxylon stygium]
METRRSSGIDHMMIDGPEFNRVVSDAMDIDVPGYYLRSHASRVSIINKTVAEYASESSTEGSTDGYMDMGDEDENYVPSDGLEQGEYDDEDYDEEYDENHDGGKAQNSGHIGQSIPQKVDTKAPMLGKWTTMPPQNPTQNPSQNLPQNLRQNPPQNLRQNPPAMAPPAPMNKVSVSTTGASLPAILINADGTSTALSPDLAEAERQKATQSIKHGMIVFSALEIESILINFKKRKLRLPTPLVQDTSSLFH